MENKSTESNEATTDSAPDTAADLRTQVAALAAEVKPDIETEEQEQDDPEMRAEVHEMLNSAPEPDPRVVALQNLCADVRSFFAARNATALAIVEDLRDAERVQRLARDAQGHMPAERLHALEQYGNTLRDLYAIRVALDEYKVHTAPEAGSEHHRMWADYSDRIFRAHDLRKQLG